MHCHHNVPWHFTSKVLNITAEQSAAQYKTENNNTTTKQLWNI